MGGRQSSKYHGIAFHRRIWRSVVLGGEGRKSTQDQEDGGLQSDFWYFVYLLTHSNYINLIIDFLISESVRSCIKYEDANIEDVSKAVKMWIGHSKRRVFRANGGSSSGSSSNESSERGGGKKKSGGQRNKLGQSGRKNGDSGATSSNGDAPSGNDRRNRRVPHQDGGETPESGLPNGCSGGIASPNTGKLQSNNGSSGVEQEEEFEDANDAPADDGELE